MIAYLDLIFIFNFIVNSLFLYIIQLIYHERINLLRILFGGLVGGLLILAFLSDYIVYYIFKMIGGAVVAVVGGGKKNIFRTIVKTSSFYLINFASIGIIGSFHLTKWYFFIAATSVLIVLIFIDCNKKTDIFINSLQYNISVTFKKQAIKMVGFL